MSEIVDRVAAAIAKQDEYDDWNGLTERSQRHYRDVAKVAIEALRDPTDAMYWAGEPFADMPKRTYQAMIDEALR